ncbi:thioredoxin domain-containing protein 6-like isoform X2 [Synchiropus splendidus]|uniref:thioredoxin domain-containing protein 6-like isoform X2 n=1 Tax=Synchiropus splendidus TaxID=270530 RepID=UPI00237DF504|nr:thioredoxin domain-containing protein 6-like isoform X2 [Synchiropus splendidus]
MAGKRKETVLQVTVTTEEDWATLLQRKGIIVVDVYSNWCGPCKPVVRHLQRMKNEIAEDELLHFATVREKKKRTGGGEGGRSQGSSYPEGHQRPTDQSQAAAEGGR